MAGTLTITTIQNDTSSPPTFRNNSVEIGTLCRAWVNFNGTGTVAIRGSFNVSSITDNGTGEYTVNMTTAMPDTNYCAIANGAEDAGGGGRFTNIDPGKAYSTTAVGVEARNSSGTLVDAYYYTVAVFR